MGNLELNQFGRSQKEQNGENRPTAKRALERVLSVNDRQNNLASQRGQGRKTLPAAQVHLRDVYFVVPQVVGNDQILCGNVASTYYVVTPMKDATHPLRDGVAYVVCSTLTTCGNQSTLGTLDLTTGQNLSVANSASKASV